VLIGRWRSLSKSLLFAGGVGGGGENPQGFKEAEPPCVDQRRPRPEAAPREASGRHDPLLRQQPCDFCQEASSRLVPPEEEGRALGRGCGGVPRLTSAPPAAEGRAARSARAATRGRSPLAWIRVGRGRRPRSGEADGRHDSLLRHQA